MAYVRRRASPGIVRGGVEINGAGEVTREGVAGEQLEEGTVGEEGGAAEDDVEEVEVKHVPLDASTDCALEGPHTKQPNCLWATGGRPPPAAERRQAATHQDSP